MMKTSFYYNKVIRVPSEGSPYKYLALIRLESILNVRENVYYSQTYLEECKYDIKDVKRSMRITDELKRSLPDESDNMPEEETDSGTEDDESGEL